MARDLVMGNGKIAVAIDSKLRARDFFYPRVGLENHLAGHEFKTGMWVNGKFSWLGNEWDTSSKYLPDTLVTKCVARNADLEVELEINDAVHSSLDLYLKKVAIKNLSDKKREVRMFFSHDFHIYGEDTGDTALYEASSNSIIHYKRRRYFLIDGATDQNQSMFQFATGYKESLGREGTWRDAEDGILQGNLIAQGAVDSTISFKLEIPPKAAGKIYYWIACGKNLNEVKDLDTKAKKIGVEQLLLETENYWSAWVNKQELDPSALPKDIARLFKTSLLIMRTHVDNHGGIISSCDSDMLQFNRDTYSYVWPRDGAITALAFDKAGFPGVSQMFFLFCDRTISADGFFYHKYSPDGSVGSSWHALVDSKGRSQLPIQEDETALVLYALWKHFQKYRDLEFISRVYDNLVLKSTEFLLNYTDTETGLPKPSFDLWEEKTGVFTSTAATACAAFEAAAGFARVFYDRERQETLNKAAARMKEAMIRNLYDRQLKRFRKAIYADGIHDATVDSSLSFIFTCGTFDARDEHVENTMNAIADELWLKTDIGGIARYQDDEYHRVSRKTPGNPWFICTLWLARWHIARASSMDQLGKGLDLLHWVTKRAMQSGVMAEQINPSSGMPISVSPLVWSHAEFVIAVCEYFDKYKEIMSTVTA